MKPDYYYYLYLSTISTFFVVVPLLIGYLRKVYLRPKEKVVFYLMAISLLTEIGGYILHRRHINNMYMYHVYTVFEFSLLSIYFMRSIQPPQLVMALKIIVVLFVGVAFFDLFSNGVKSLDNISTATESILMMLYSITVFYFLLKNSTYSNVMSVPVFWINTGVLLYFSGNLFLFISSNYLQHHSNKVYYELWGIHSILNIIFYLLISTGFWKTKTP